VPPGGAATGGAATPRLLPDAAGTATPATARTLGLLLPSGRANADLAAELSAARALAARFASDNASLAAEARALRALRAAVDADYKGALDELDALRARLDAMEGGVGGGNGGGGGAAVPTTAAMGCPAPPPPTGGVALPWRRMTAPEALVI
jgi:hypothetical protein